MALKSELMAASMPPALASKVGYDPMATVAAAGSSQATATSLTANCSNVTSGSGGVILGPSEVRDPVLIVNNSGGTVSVYPPVGGTINGGTLNAAFSLTNGKALSINAVGTNYIANMSA